MQAHWRALQSLSSEGRGGDASLLDGSVLKGLAKSEGMVPSDPNPTQRSSPQRAAPSARLFKPLSCAICAMEERPSAGLQIKLRMKKRRSSSPLRQNSLLCMSSCPHTDTILAHRHPCTLKPAATAAGRATARDPKPKKWAAGQRLQPQSRRLGQSQVVLRVPPPRATKMRPGLCGSGRQFRPSRPESSSPTSSRSTPRRPSASPWFPRPAIPNLILEVNPRGQGPGASAGSRGRRRRRGGRGGGGGGG